MTSKEKLEVFSPELSVISDNKILTVVEELISEIPDKFFTAPASSSGKYHPVQCRGEKGLVVHTKIAFNIVRFLIPAYGYKEGSYDESLVLGAILIHDAWKYGSKGDQERTIPNHGELYAEYLRSKISKGNSNSIIFRDLASIIEIHHGIWSTSEITPDEMKDSNHVIVHLADYFASRHHLVTNFL